LNKLLQIMLINCAQMPTVLAAVVIHFLHLRKPRRILTLCGLPSPWFFVFPFFVFPW